MSAPLSTAALLPSPEASADDHAILRTVIYAGLFQFPLSIDELERRLMDASLDARAIRARLRAPFLRERLDVTDGLVHPRGREGWIELRRRRGARAEALVHRHRHALALLAGCPFVRLVALSGGCAHGNATDEDVDVFLVVRMGRAWSVFGAVMVLAKVFGLRRTLCVNYVVDETAQSLPERDLFTASEIVGLRPLAGRVAYAQFVAANAWVGETFPNFARRTRETGAIGPAGAARWCEALLDLGPAPVLEGLARRVLGAYLRKKASGAAGVVLEPSRLKLHLHDHRPELLTAFDAATERAEP
jgi:hypothetical protein